ncbi:MAG TPA: HD domain-containing phosphohydrolase [Vicinamibacterales bacterium]
MSQPWLIAGLVLVSAAVLYFGNRIYRAVSARLAAERQHAQQMAELHLAAIEALALAIDAKDQTAPNHIRRVQTYATGVARAMGMNEDEIQGIRTAALLHDIGKLAVPEHILAKPGPLTPEEFQKVRIHSQVGADIIAGVPFPYPVAPLILSHHERWDGRGYPSGLKQDEIPLGARILCVVDYFDALTSDRPYHKPIGNEAALAILQQDAGKALDPSVVSAFARIMPRLRADVEKEELETPRAGAYPLRRGEGLRTLGAVPAEAKASVFDDIALAHREIYALYQIAQTMGTSLGVSDTMALIASKLANLVPFSACALFIYSDSNDTLGCRFATGTDSELLQQLSLRSGQGLTGWVARNRRPLVNARPGADIEAMNSDAPTVLQSALVCPLIFGERFIGTLAVYHTEPSFYRDDHRRLLDRVCEQAAAVIHNSIVFERTQEDSLTDPLTGLPNTRFMFMHLTRELARAERLKSEVSLLVMDLNDFKEINDNHGHHIGDKALRAVASMLRTAVRPYDICVRYAGDEFIVVLSGCGYDEAESKRLELQDAIDRLTFEARPGVRLPLSISAGAAVFPHDGDSYESLLAKADSRMYGDKSLRKNDPTRQLGAGEASYEMAVTPRHSTRPN